MVKSIGFSFGQLDMTKVRAAEKEHEKETKEHACTQITKRVCISRLGAAVLCTWCDRVPCTPPEHSLYGPAETAVATVPCTPPVHEFAATNTSQGIPIPPGGACLQSQPQLDQRPPQNGVDRQHTARNSILHLRSTPLVTGKGRTPALIHQCYAASRAEQQPAAPSEGKIAKRKHA